MSKEGRTLAKLGRGETGEVAQVGSYRTDLAQTVTTVSDAFELDTIVRVKSYNGDNWVKRNRNVITISGTNEGYLDGEYVFDGDDAWVKGKYRITYPFNSWQIQDPTVPFTFYTNTTTLEAEVPTTGWLTSPGGAASTVVTADTNVTTGTVGEGLLLEDGGELTLLMFANESIATIGGTLNVVPVTK